MMVLRSQSRCPRLQVISSPPPLSSSSRTTWLPIKCSFMQLLPSKVRSVHAVMKPPFSVGALMNIDAAATYIFRRSLGRLGSSSSQHRRTLELVLQNGHASFRITSSHSVQRIAASSVCVSPQSRRWGLPLAPYYTCLPHARLEDRGWRVEGCRVEGG